MSTDRGWPPVGAGGGQRWAWGGTLLSPMAWPWDLNDGMGVPSGAQYPTSHPWDPKSGMGGGLQQCPVPHVSSLGPQWWHGGGSQLCQDPINGRGVPSCALTPGTPVMAHGSLAVLVSPPPNAGGRGYRPCMLPPPMVGGGHTISTAPLCLGRVMGHRASPPPGTPQYRRAQSCAGGTGWAQTPPPGVGLGAGGPPPKGYPHSFPPSCSESGCAEKWGGYLCPLHAPPPLPGEVSRGHVGVRPPPHPRPSLLPRGRVCTSSARR